MTTQHVKRKAVSLLPPTLLPKTWGRTRARISIQRNTCDISHGLRCVGSHHHPRMRNHCHPRSLRHPGILAPPPLPVSSRTRALWCMRHRKRTLPAQTRKSQRSSPGLEVSAILMEIYVVLMFSGVYLIFLFLFEVKLLQRFFHWLTGPDCDKDSKTAIQHCRQVRYIWGKVSPNFRPEEILEIDRIKEEWLGPFLTTFQPGTAKSYCGSASLFVDFLLSKNVVQNRGKAAAAMAQFGRLSKTLRKRTLRRRTQVETEALGKFCNLFTGWPVFMTFIVVHIVHLFLGRIARNACPDTDLPAESNCDSDGDAP